MTHLDNHDELHLDREPDLDAVMFWLDVELAVDADRERRSMGTLWGRADLLVDPDGTVRYD